MRMLEGSEIDLAREYFREAREEAEKSPLSTKFWAVLVKGGNILTKCAGESALLDTIERLSLPVISDSTLYFAELNHNHQITCTKNYLFKSASELAFNKGVKEWIFLNEEGWRSYTSEEYYNLSNPKLQEAKTK